MHSASPLSYQFGMRIGWLALSCMTIMNIHRGIRAPEVTSYHALVVALVSLTAVLIVYLCLKCDQVLLALYVAMIALSSITLLFPVRNIVGAMTPVMWMGFFIAISIQRRMLTKDDEQGE